ncbi:substrate-binding domain-containing protein [Devosia sp. ZB163]|uniref:sugar ABC transporter substrate-binding protein n=1 Tax=Devosia sp. ZB163 TaxID=3025938 RepID=UPI00235F9195|nr:substrate-binding domain-containing protein [Devosia sp. ZB163]MDC9822776.1 substrate-binding domain-containing protein [Devosia sp. ZB163]
MTKTYDRNTVMATRRHILAAAAALGGTALTAPILAAFAQDKPLKFAFANVTEAGELFKQLGDGFVDVAQKAGITVSRYDNKFDGVTATNNARLMVQEQPDVIFEYNAVEGIGPALRRTFEQANIPFVAINVPVPGGHWFNLVNKDLGIEAADTVVGFAKEKGWTADDTTVLIVQASASGVEVNDCVRYFYVRAAELMGFPQVDPEAISATTTVISPAGVQVDGKATLEDSYTSVKNVLQTIPADRNLLLFTVNDDSAVGAWRAVQESGRGEKTLIGGLGGSIAALKELRENPQWVAEGSIFIANWGVYLVAMGIAITQSVTPPALTKSPQAVITKADVDKFYDAAGTAILLPPLVEENRYLADTGILQKYAKIEGL